MENCVEAPLTIKLFLDDSHKHINSYGDPDLHLDGMGGCSQKRFYLAMLLDPLEERLHLPSCAIQFRKGERWQNKIGCQEDECLTTILIVPVIDNPSMTINGA
ncbi:MAG: hypothetical protein OXC62_07335 [Aestuariivita sp.]|nr:hypothetical protein [Aestuariivita sp.]